MVGEFKVYIDFQQIVARIQPVAFLLHNDSDERKAVEKMNDSGNSAEIGMVGLADFEAEVLKSPLPVLAAFGAAWSRPCHLVESVLNEVAAACAGRVKVVKVDADDNPDLSLCYEIESIPTLLCFVGGKVRARVVGTASKEAILAKLQPVFGSAGN